MSIVAPPAIENWRLELSTIVLLVASVEPLIVTPPLASPKLLSLTTVKTLPPVMVVPPVYVLALFIESDNVPPPDTVRPPEPVMVEEKPVIVNVVLGAGSKAIPPPMVKLRWVENVAVVTSADPLVIDTLPLVLPKLLSLLMLRVPPP